MDEKTIGLLKASQKILEIEFKSVLEWKKGMSKKQNEFTQFSINPCFQCSIVL